MFVTKNFEEQNVLSTYVKYLLVSIDYLAYILNTKK